jgi:hypothetical protein
VSAPVVEAVTFLGLLLALIGFALKMPGPSNEIN